MLLVFALGLASWPVRADENMAPPQQPKPELVLPVMVPRAPVFLDGEVLFEVRGVSGYPAEVRAQKVSDGIEAFAADLGRSLQSLRLSDEGEITMVYAGNQPLMGIINADGRLEGGVERQVLAQVYLKRIAEAVKEHREQRKPKNLMFAIFYALAATGILALGWWGLRWTFNRLDAAI
jgi:hypothetical protein